jgi:hypothetical protein
LIDVITDRRHRLHLQRRHLLPFAAIAAFVIPAAALARGKGPLPNESWYQQRSPGWPYVDRSVLITVNSETHKASIDVFNPCLLPGATANSPWVAIPPTRLRGISLSYQGRVRLRASGLFRFETVPVVLKAADATHAVTGTIQFPRTSCGTIHFNAKLTAGDGKH